MTDPLIWNAAIKAAANAVAQSAWKHRGSDAYSRGMDYGAMHQNKTDYEAILALAKSAPDLRAVADHVARAICKESCAFYGEPPCYQTGDWPNSQCNEPGCQSLAIAALGLEGGE